MQISLRNTDIYIYDRRYLQFQNSDIMFSYVSFGFQPFKADIYIWITFLY